MDCRNKNSSFGPMNKRGVTLVEVLVVVAIMGILASLGVSSMQQAVRNMRIKDAALNVAAYMERSASNAVRLNKTLCVKAAGQKLRTYDAACSVTTAAIIDSLVLESLNEFVTNGDVICAGTTRYQGNQADLVPKIGLSAVPAGCFLVRYGATDHYGAAIKTANKNSVFYRLSYDSGASWMD